MMDTLSKLLPEVMAGSLLLLSLMRRKERTQGGNAKQIVSRMFKNQMMVGVGFESVLFYSLSRILYQWYVYVVFVIFLFIEMQGGQLQPRRDFNRANEGQPQARTFTYQSSSVTYGGVNGAYYTASKTRRTGSDGVSKYPRDLLMYSSLFGTHK